MTAAGPAAGDSWASVAGSPTCRAGLRGAVRTSLQQLPAAIPGEVVSDVVLPVSEAVTTPSCVGSCASHTAPLDEPLRAWAVAHRSVGRRVVLCEGPLRDAVTLRRCVLGDGDRRGAQADRGGRADLPRPPTTGNTGLLESQVEREVDATPARQSAPVALGELPATLIGQGGEAALHARCRVT
jgi:hypothetical protein